MKKLFISMGVIALVAVGFAMYKAPASPSVQDVSSSKPTTSTSENTNQATTSQTVGSVSKPVATSSTKTSGGTKPAPQPKPSGITLAQIAQHASASSCWMAIDGNVYDVTSFISQHPGGRAILMGCGKDASQMFDSRHSDSARALLPSFYIGKLSS